jgi:hypothetical protein
MQSAIEHLVAQLYASVIRVIATLLIALVTTTRFLLVTASCASLLDRGRFVTFDVFTFSPASTLDLDDSSALRTLARVAFRFARVHHLVVFVQETSTNMFARGYRICALGSYELVFDEKFAHWRATTWTMCQFGRQQSAWWTWSVMAHLCTLVFAAIQRFATLFCTVVLGRRATLCHSFAQMRITSLLNCHIAWFTLARMAHLTTFV